MPKGRVKWFDEDKGYGFIVPRGGSVDVFVRREEIQQGGIPVLSEGDQVSYKLTRGRKGPQADDVKKL